MFEVGDACRSIDVTKDSKHLIAASATEGFRVFNVSNGKLATKVNVAQGMAHQFKQVSLSFGDKELLTLSDYQKISTIRVFDFDQVLRRKEDEPARMTLQIDGKKETTFNHAVWGPLNKSIYVATTTGHILVFDT